MGRRSNWCMCSTKVGSLVTLANCCCFGIGLELSSTLRSISEVGDGGKANNLFLVGHSSSDITISHSCEAGELASLAFFHNSLIEHCRCHITHSGVLTCRIR